MFKIYDLDKKYQYDYSVKKSIRRAFMLRRFDKKDPYQLVAFINDFVKVNRWEWDRVTLHICRRIEYLIQEELPSGISNKKEIFSWIINGWKK